MRLERGAESDGFLGFSNFFGGFCLMRSTSQIDRDGAQSLHLWTGLDLKFESCLEIKGWCLGQEEKRKRKFDGEGGNDILDFLRRSDSAAAPGVPDAARGLSQGLRWRLGGV